MKQRIQSLNIYRQASNQWHRAGQWLDASLEGTSLGLSGGLAKAVFWVVAAIWRGLILLAAAFSLAVEVVAQPVGIAVELFDALLGWPLALLFAPIELLFSVPYLGRALGWLWRGATTLFWGISHLIELPLVLLAVMPERRLRLWVLPLMDEQGNAPLALDDWLRAIEVTARILRREANIRLLPVTPFQLRYGLGATEMQAKEHEFIPLLPPNRDGSKTQVGCNRQAIIEDLGAVGGQLDRLALMGHPRGSYRRVTGWGSALMAVAVQSVDEGRLAGCSLGPLTDYLTVRADQPVCLAHEVGHACNLLHSSAPNNLMNPTCGGVHLSRWQVLLLRLSRHVTYL